MITPNQLAVLDVIRDAAKAGRACPTNEEIVKATTYSQAKTVTKALDVLQEAGLIRIRNQRNCRSILHCATGKWTQPTDRPKAQRYGLSRCADARAERVESLFAVLNKAAEEGAPCPLTRELAAAIGAKSTASVSDYLDKLATAGRITIAGYSGGRVVTITSTGKKTGAASGVVLPMYRKPRQDAADDPLPAQPRVFRDPCPGCGVRMDADPAMCCDRGRALRKLVA